MSSRILQQQKYTPESLSPSRCLFIGFLVNVTPLAATLVAYCARESWLSPPFWGNECLYRAKLNESVCIYVYNLIIIHTEYEDILPA